MRATQVLNVGVKYQFNAEQRNAVMVDLGVGTCTCLDYKHRRLVCKHMFCALRMANRPLSSLPQSVWHAPHLAIDEEAMEKYSYVTKDGEMKAVDKQAADTAELHRKKDPDSHEFVTEGMKNDLVGGPNSGDEVFDDSTNGAPDAAASTRSNAAECKARKQRLLSEFNTTVKALRTHVHSMLDSNNVDGVEVVQGQFQALTEDTRKRPGACRGDMCHKAGGRVRNRGHGGGSSRHVRGGETRKYGEFKAVLNHRPKGKTKSNLIFAERAVAAAQEHKRKQVRE
jgi:hypothetical protein